MLEELEIPVGPTDTVLEGAVVSPVPEIPVVEVEPPVAVAVVSEPCEL